MSHRAALSSRNTFYHVCTQSYAHGYLATLGFLGGRGKEEGGSHSSPGWPPSLGSTQQSSPAKVTTPNPRLPPRPCEPLPSTLSALRPSAQAPDTTFQSLSGLTHAGQWCSLRECTKPSSQHMLGNSYKFTSFLTDLPPFTAWREQVRIPECQSWEWPKRSPEAQRGWVTCSRSHSK